VRWRDLRSAAADADEARDADASARETLSPR